MSLTHPIHGTPQYARAQRPCGRVPSFRADRLRRYQLAALVLVLVFSGCPHDEPPKESKPIRLSPLAVKTRITPAMHRFAKALTVESLAPMKGDLAEIRRRGTLRVITRNNSRSYFLYRGTEAGFHYELAKLFAKELGVRLEIVVPTANRDVIPYLLEGRGDIVMSGLSLEAPRIDRVLTTRAYMETPLVLVTGKKFHNENGWGELSGKTVSVRSSSSSFRRLRKLPARYAEASFVLKAVRESLEPEDILDLVEEGESDVAVVEKRVADIELVHRPNLKIAYTMPGALVRSTFATRRKSPALHRAADKFLKSHHRDTVFNILYKRYHKNTKRAAAVRKEEFRLDRQGKISPWDDILRAEADKSELDWRLVAAQVYQESRFVPTAESDFGAQGLMQIMPATARSLGLSDPFDPRESVKAGTKYLRQMMAHYAHIPRLDDRISFALAAYNVGMGHVDDAVIIAEEAGLAGDRWFGNVESAMLSLSKPRVYQDAKYGYARGEEPVKYVAEIRERYKNYVAATGGSLGLPATK